jgi:hypothetical protein
MLTGTSLNRKISFISLGEAARSKHDVASHGIRPCGLHPVCGNMFRGGEDIALVFVVSPTPTFHKNFEKETWVCFYHADASIEGLEVQTQQKFKATDTKSATQDAPTKSNVERS